MIVNHKGFDVIGMTGNTSAQVTDDGSYVEVILAGFKEADSFDLEGLVNLISDLEAVQQLANQVEKTNAIARGMSNG